MRHILILLVISLSQLRAQVDCPLDFQGDWVKGRTLQAFKGFTTDYVWAADSIVYKDSGLICVTFQDLLDGNPDPSPEQLATYKFICENQDFIRSVLLDSSRYYFADWIEETYSYGRDHLTEKEWANREPLNISQLMTPLDLNIFTESKDGFAYYGIGGHCVWEADEGFGYVLHKRRIIDAEVSFVAFENDAIRIDNGTYQSGSEHKEDEVYQPGITLTPKPILHTPHPKYGKLKPKQEFQNKYYIPRLIAHGYTEDVIKLYEKGEIKNIRSKSADLLYAAVQANQLDLVEFFLSQKSDSLDGLLHRAAYNHNQKMVELLLDHGSDINGFEHKGTPLDHNDGTWTYYSSVVTRLKKDVQAFREWFVSKGAMTREEIITDLIEKEDYSSIDAFIESNKNSYGNDDLAWELHIQSALDDGRNKMAEFLFSKYIPEKRPIAEYRLTNLMKTAFNFQSKDLMEYAYNLGADINIGFIHFGHTYLERARSFQKNATGKRAANFKEIEEWLLSKGAKTLEEVLIDLFESNSFEELKALSKSNGALNFSEEYKYKEYIALTLKINKSELAKALIDDMVKQDFHPMFTSVELVDRELVEYCLSKEININEMNISGLALDHLPSDQHSPVSQEELADFKAWLISKGAKTQLNVVQDLILSSDLDSIKALVEDLKLAISHPDNVKDHITFAVKNDKMAIAEYFIKNCRSKELFMRSAVEDQNTPLVSLLLERGFDINTIQSNATALDVHEDRLALKIDHSPESYTFRDFLLDKGAKTSLTIFKELMETNPDSIVLHEFNKKDFHFTNNYRVASFIKAALNSGRKDLAVKLFSYGNHWNSDMQLKFGILCGSPLLVQYVLDRGAEINKLNWNSETPLDYFKKMIAKMEGQDKAEAEKLYAWLMEKGAKLGVKN